MNLKEKGKQNSDETLGTSYFVGSPNDVYTYFPTFWRESRFFYQNDVCFEF